MAPVLLLLASLVAGGDDLIRRYLAADDAAQVAMIDPAISALLKDPVETSRGCPTLPNRDAAAAKLTRIGDAPRFLVEWKAGGGRGATRFVLSVKGEGDAAKVLDLRPVAERAARHLRDGELQETLALVEKGLKIDPWHDELLALSARVAARLGDAVRAEKALALAKEKNPDSAAWRFAAYDVALQLKKADAPAARDACFEAVRAAQLDDSRCFVLHVTDERTTATSSLLRQEIEEALGRSPDEPGVRMAQGLLLYGLARGSKPDPVMLSTARVRLREALQCREALDEKDRAAALNAVAVATLDLRDGTCAGDAEAAVLADPTVSEYRRTLQACAEATILVVNQRNRRTLKESAVDLQLEGQAITLALMRDKAALGGRKLPAFEAYQRCRVQVRQTGERLEITLQDLNAPKRKNRAEDAVAAAFMVHQVYRALYGDDAPKITNVRSRYAGDPSDYIFPMPDTVKPAWNNALPADKEIAAMAATVVTRPSE